MLTSWKESYDQPRQHVKKQRHYFANKCPSSRSYGFSCSHVWMWELDYKESWMLKNWCFWTVLFEKTLENRLDCKEIQLVHLKGNQSRTFIGRTDAEDEAPVLWPRDAKYWLIGKDPGAGKDWRQEEGDDRGWDGWMALLTRWTWVSASSRRRLEKAMATHSNTLAWKIPLTEKPSRLQSMGSLRVGHDCDFAFTFHFPALEKEMATHSSILAWRIPWTEKPSRLQSMGSQRVRPDRATELNWTD